MELKSKSWYAWYYRQFYGYSSVELPKSLCVFFWKMLFSLIVFPISWPGFIFYFIDSKRESEYPDAKGKIGVAVWFSGLILSIIVLSLFGITPKSPTCLLWLPLLGIFLFGVIVLLAYCFYILYEFLSNRFKSKKPKKVANKNWFQGGVKSSIGKYCPKINWK
jgi:hypothetical protein